MEESEESALLLFYQEVEHQVAEHQVVAHQVVALVVAHDYFKMICAKCRDNHHQEEGRT